MRGSTDITGPIIYGGNFILESDNIDVKLLYFTEEIENWQGTLNAYLNDSVYGSNKLMKDINGNLIWLHKDISGNNINCPFNSDGTQIKFEGGENVVVWGVSSVGGNFETRYPENSDLNTGVVAIYSTRTAFATLKSNGSVVTWGDINNGGSYETRYPLDGNLSSGVSAIYSTNNAFAALKSNGQVITWGNTDRGGRYATRYPDNADLS